jgi:hypothetical protein
MKMLGACLVLLFVSNSTLLAEEGKPEKKEVKEQTTCPVMGGKIVKDLYVDYDGKRIYLCCAGCVEPVKKDPAKHIKKLEDEGITLAQTPIALCRKCGEIKGTDTCCKIEGRKKCGKCGLLKGAPGCCKLPKEGKGPVELCAKCGEIKGTDKCCKLEGRTQCKKCGLLEGSAGCCKLTKKAESAPAEKCGACAGAAGAGHACRLPRKADAKTGASKKHGHAHKKAGGGCCGGCGGKK